MIPMPLKFEKGSGTIPFPEKIDYAQDASMSGESYEINIASEGVIVKYGDEKGLFYAGATLGSLGKDGTLPIGKIFDKPKYAHRGLNLDVSRHFFTAEEVKKVIDILAILKMNVLHWHLSDDQGFRIESLKYPGLQKESKDYYTREQIKDIVKYAKERCVEIIPEIDMPGHTRAILAAFPDFSCSKKKLPVGRSAGIYKKILCAGNEDVYPFLEELLEEVTELFPSPYFHIGGDEAPKGEWKACPACQAKLKELGLTNMEDLQGYFSVRVSKMLEKFGKTPIIWCDALLSKNQPENAVIQYWAAMYNRQTAAFAKDGGKWIYSDMFEVYLDYPYSMTGLKKMYEMPMNFGSMGEFDAYPPIGMEAALWTERVDTNEKLEERLLPRLFAFAELAWTGRVSTYEEFEKRAEEEAAKFTENGYAVKPRDWWNPEGPGRLTEAKEFMALMSGVDFEDEREELVTDGGEPNPEVNNAEFEKMYRERFFRPEDMAFLEDLAEAEEDVKSDRVAPVKDTLDDLRKMLDEN